MIETQNERLLTQCKEDTKNLFIYNFKVKNNAKIVVYCIDRYQKIVIVIVLVYCCYNIL